MIPTEEASDDELGPVIRRPLRPDAAARRLVRPGQDSDHTMLPIALRGSNLIVATSRPDDADLRDALISQTGRRVTLTPATSDEIAFALAGEEPRGRECVVDNLRDNWLRALGPAGRAPQVEQPTGMDRGYDRWEALSLALDLPFLRLSSHRVNSTLAQLLSEGEASALMSVVLAHVGGQLIVATSQPGRLGLTCRLQELTGLPVRLVVAEREAVQRALPQAYRSAAAVAALHERRWRDKTGGAVYLAGEALAWLKHRYIDVSGDSPSTPSPEASPRLRVSQIAEAKALRSVLPVALCRRLKVLLIGEGPGHYTVAIAGDDVNARLNTLFSILDRPLQPVLITEERLRRAYKEVHGALLDLPVAVGAAWDTVPRRSDPHGSPDLRDYLMALGYITPDAYASGVLRARAGEHPLRALLRLGLLGATDVIEADAVRLGIPWVRPGPLHPSAAALARLPYATAIEYVALPLRLDGGILHVAVTDASSPTKVHALEDATRLRLRLVLASASEIERAIERAYHGVAAELLSPEIQFLDHLVDSGQITRPQRNEVEGYVRGEGLSLDRALEAGAGMSDEKIAAELASYTGTTAIEIWPSEELRQVVDALGNRSVRHRLVDPVAPETARLLPLETAQRLAALPVATTRQGVRVAIVNPLEGAAIDEIARAAGRSVEVAVATRKAVESAIRRTIGRKTLGDYLVQSGTITVTELDQALALQQRTGVRLGKALQNLGFVTEAQVSEFLSEQHDIPYFELTPEAVDSAAAHLISEELARTHAVLPLAIDSSSALVAMVDPLDTLALDEIRAELSTAIRPVLVGEMQLQRTLETVFRQEYLERATSDLLARSPEDSASIAFTRRQKQVFLGIAIASVLLFVLAPIPFVTAMMGLTTAFYSAFSLYKLGLILRTLNSKENVFTDAGHIFDVAERDLPTYSIMVPMFRETAVLPMLVNALSRLDYPRTKLEVLLLLEESDTGMIEAANAMRLPMGFRVVLVPAGQPQGKPRACNYGLIQAKGEYVALYDAEDVPEPDQLKKALSVFLSGDASLVCVQARLNYYNREQNLLTKWFTAEYCTWFDLFLPGLALSGAPIPLGGTSNHFRTRVLRELGGWDPYNVTEDADLGIRIFKAGMKTAVVDSTTYEEANADTLNWVRQRSRWVKGYMQTWLVRMRHPIELWRAIGTYPFISFQLVVGGTVFSLLVNPILWALTGVWFLTHWDILQQVFPGAVFYTGAAGLYLGNFAFVYINGAGCLSRQYYHLVRYCLLTPIYWALMSVAAWKALYQLLVRPSYWEKTTHGLYKGKVRIPLQTPGAAP